MANLEHINIQHMYPVKSEGLNWVSQHSQNISNLPHIFFKNGEPWLAANQYALYKFQGVSGNNIKTVDCSMNHLRAYACWFEENGRDWRDFPRKKKDRCIFRFRGFLIDQRDEGLISPSTTTTRMGAVIQFYRWAKIHGWVEREQLWEDKFKAFNFYTAVGFSRTMSVVTSELSIPNRRRHGLTLEDGLLPLVTESRDLLLRFLKEKGLVELFLMTMIGCFSGARSETIRTLRISTIENALDDQSASGIKRISVGPGTKVKTKFDVSGYLLFPNLLVHELERYGYSARRLTRQARATDEDKTLLFLTERGNQYSETTFTKLISNLREKLVGAGFTQFRDFKFHQTRATFGTLLMKFAMETLPSQVDAIVFVRDALLHKDESTTWRYIKFIEREPLKEQLSEEFFNLFTGKVSDAQNLINQVTYDDLA